MKRRPSETNSENRLDPFYQKIDDQAEKITSAFLLGLFLVGIVLSFFHGTYIIAFVAGGVTLLIHFLSLRWMSGTLGARMITGMLFWNFALQFLYQMNGMTEIKSLFFIAMTIMLLFEDWRVFIPMTAYALISLVTLHYAKNATLVVDHFGELRDTPLASLIIQTFVFTAYAILCAWWASVQHQQTRESALASIEMEDQLRMTEVNIAFADHISHGQLASTYGSAEPDKLGVSLLNMRDSLVKAAEREEREKFINAGLARIADILRKHANDLDQLCDEVIDEVVKYMKANQGFIFVRETEHDKEFLHLKAARAWERKKYIDKRIEFGDGLVGQAAIEKHTFYLTRVPANYVNITSGLGQSNPRCLLIVPLLAEQELVGVIELASFKTYDDFEIKFLERVGESIAATILTTRNNQRTKELLGQSNMMAEQMKAQEEEMRQNMEEMQATQEEMERKNVEIQRLLSEASEREQHMHQQLLEMQKLKKETDRRNEASLTEVKKFRETLLNILDELPHKIFLKDSDGKMVLVNTAVAKAHNLTVDELIGKSDFDFVDHTTAQQWRNQELEIIRKGSDTYIFNETLAGETRTLKSTKKAFFIPHLGHVGLLGIQTDITELESLKAATKTTAV